MLSPSLSLLPSLSLSSPPQRSVIFCVEQFQYLANREQVGGGVVVGGRGWRGTKGEGGGLEATTVARPACPP